MYLMSFTALAGAAGKYWWGALCDRVDPKKAVMAMFATAALGLAIGLAPGSRLTLPLFILIYGFSMGGVVSTGPIMIAHVFGGEFYASIARFVGVLINSSLLGYLTMGLSFSLTGSYNPAYAIFVVLYILAIWLIYSIKLTSGQLRASNPLS